MNTIFEQWRTISGFPNYQISNIGRVILIKSGKILKSRANTHGYQIIGLTSNYKQTMCQIHRLVALEFIENIENKPCVDHVDRNRVNNNINNLRWVTHQQNNMNSTKSTNNKSSQYRGVCWDKRGKKWESKINLNHTKIFIGYFADEKDAARAYNNKAIELCEEYANLNEISDND